MLSMMILVNIIIFILEILCKYTKIIGLIILKWIKKLLNPRTAVNPIIELKPIVELKPIEKLSYIIIENPDGSLTKYSIGIKN